MMTEGIQALLCKVLHPDHDISGGSIGKTFGVPIQMGGRFRDQK